MIEQEARVEAIDGDDAVVVIARQSACGSCHAKAGCGTSLVGSLFPERRLSLRLPNTRQAAPGDRVVVGLPGAALQSAALLLYGLPLLALLAGAMAGQSLAGTAGWPAEPGAVLGGLFGLLAGLAVVRRKAGMTGVQPVMLRRLPAAASGHVALDALQHPQPHSSEK